VWIRVRRGRAVTLARNGQRVLHTMYAASAGVCKRSLDVNALSHNLPWLPAFDRRDVLVIKAAMEKVAMRASRRARRSSVAVSDNMDAIALSIYYAAIFSPSPGDAVDGRSLRKWLNEYKPFSASRYSDETTFMNDVPRALWLDAPSPLAATDSVSYERAVLDAYGQQQPTERSLRKQSTGHLQPARLVTCELQDLGWTWVPGITDSCVLPCGGWMWVPTRPCGSARSAHGLEQLPPLTAINMCATAATLPFLAGFLSYSIGASAALEARPYLASLMLKDSPMTIAMCVLCSMFAMAMVMVASSKGLVDGGVCRGGRVPKPLLTSAKVEYAVVGFAISTQAFFVVGLAIDQHRLLDRVSGQMTLAIGNGTAVRLFTPPPLVFATVSMTAAVSCVIGVVAAYEAALAAAHALVAATRHRSLLYLFAFTTSIAERDVRVL